MKKSRIIIPALGVVLLSAGASVSGTVAWFTANRSVNLTAGNFTAVNPSASLEIKVNSDKSTEVKDGKINVKDKMRDGSVNISNGTLTVYKATLSGTSVTGYTAFPAEATNYLDGGNARAVTWSAQYTNKASAGYKLDLYFDGVVGDGHSTFSDESQFSKGFRIAMYTTGTSAKTVVWAPEREDAQLDHVTGTSTTSIGKFDNVRGVAVPDATKTQSEGQAQKNFLGTIDGGSTLTVYFVAWYEGEDPEVVNGATIPADAATAVLTFKGLSPEEDYKKS